MRCLVTGSSGFVGQHLVKALLKKGHRVIGLTRERRSRGGFLEIEGDLRDYSERKFKTLCSRVDVVFHLAGVTEYNIFTQNPALAFETNVSVTSRLLNAFSKSRAKHFIYPSSGKVYGPPRSLPFREDHPLQPTTKLGRTKKIIELMMEELALGCKKRFTILRIFNLYGPGQKESFFIPTLLKQINQGNTLRLGDLKSRRDFIYISDLISALMVVIRKSTPGLCHYNVGTGQSTSPLEIIRLLERLLHRKWHISFQTRRRQGEYSEERADIGSLSRLGWHPRVSLKEGLQNCLGPG